MNLEQNKVNVSGRRYLFFFLASQNTPVGDSNQCFQKLGVISYLVVNQVRKLTRAVRGNSRCFCSCLHVGLEDLGEVLDRGNGQIAQQVRETCCIKNGLRGSLAKEGYDLYIDCQLSKGKELDQGMDESYCGPWVHFWLLRSTA